MPHNMKQSIIDRCTDLQQKDYVFIYHIIKDTRDGYTENSNGIWVNLDLMPNVVLWKIDGYLKTIEERECELRQPTSESSSTSSSSTDDDEDETSTRGHKRNVVGGKDGGDMPSAGAKPGSILHAFGATFEGGRNHAQPPCDPEAVLKKLKQRKSAELSNYDKSIIKKSRYINRQVLFKNYQSHV